LKCDGTRAETRFRLSAKRTILFKSAGASVQSTTGSRGVRISGSNAGYTMFRCSVKGTGYPLHSPVSPSLPLLCVTVCHHVSAGVCYIRTSLIRIDWDDESSGYAENPDNWIFSLKAGCIRSLKFGCYYLRYVQRVSQYRWPRGLRRRSAAACQLSLCVRIPP